MNQQQTPAEQIEALKQQLLEAYVQKENADAQVKAAVEKIAAIRNVLGGVQLGEALEASKAAPQTDTE